MKKFCRKKIAIALACTSILGGKSPTTLYPQTVEAAGRSVESPSKGFVNWVKNHKLGVGVGVLTAITAVTLTILGVKYLGKKDQKNPNEHEEKVDEKGNNKQNQVPSEKKEADIEKDDGKGNDIKEKGEFFGNNQEIIKNIVCKNGADKITVLKNLEKLKVKVNEWLKDTKKYNKDIYEKQKGTFFTEEANEEDIKKVLSFVCNIFSGTTQLKNCEASISNSQFNHKGWCEVCLVANNINFYFYTNNGSCDIEFIRSDSLFNSEKICFSFKLN